MVLEPFSSDLRPTHRTRSGSVPVEYTQDRLLSPKCVLSPHSISTPRSQRCIPPPLQNRMQRAAAHACARTVDLARLLAVHAQGSKHAITYPSVPAALPACPLLISVHSPHHTSSRTSSRTSAPTTSCSFPHEITVGHGPLPVRTMPTRHGPQTIINKVNTGDGISQG
ncbi:hypothetical protein BD779DRAFT_1562877 [Infundibulicybe gibba]|nr:hypothetical protein BD779DRAFT_1562877 [Infundibulicybe gibba]